MVTVNIGMLHYVLDHVYGAFVHRTKISPPFFSRGWGGTKLDLLERLIKQLFPEVEGQNWPPTLVQPIWTTVWETKTACLREGVFRTPCDEQILSALPPECHNARVAFLSPKLVPPEKMACVVHLAGTGDHTFERRLRLGGPLLKENIATMVLESPFYGKRRPMLQCGAKLLCVSDLLLLGRATIEEARSLLYWLDTEEGDIKACHCMGGIKEDLAVQKAAMTLEEDDGYIPKHSVLELQRAWPGSEVRWVTGGHVSSFLLHNGETLLLCKDSMLNTPRDCTDVTHGFVGFADKEADPGAGDNRPPLSMPLEHGFQYLEGDVLFITLNSSASCHYTLGEVRIKSWLKPVLICARFSCAATVLLGPVRLLLSGSPMGKDILVAAKEDRHMLVASSSLLGLSRR
ncbi:hypothetical protein C3L33_12159, partial [Rhododendron williamsianum]